MYIQQSCKQFSIAQACKSIYTRNATNTTSNMNKVVRKFAGDEQKRVIRFR